MSHDQEFALMLEEESRQLKTIILRPSPDSFKLAHQIQVNDIRLLMTRCKLSCYDRKRVIAEIMLMHAKISLVLSEMDTCPEGNVLLFDPNTLVGLDLHSLLEVGANVLGEFSDRAPFDVDTIRGFCEVVVALAVANA